MRFLFWHCIRLALLDFAKFIPPKIPQRRYVCFDVSVRPVHARQVQLSDRRRRIRLTQQYIRPGTAYACGRDAWSHQSGWRIEMNAEGITRRHWPSVAGCVYSEDRGRSWHAGALADGMENGNETTVAQLADGGLLFCCRNMNADRCRVLTVRYSATRDRAGTGSRTWIHSARTSTSPCARGERRSAQAELAAYCRRAHGRYH